MKESKTSIKNIFLIINFVLQACFANAQNALIDTLKKELAQAKDDTARFLPLGRLAVMYAYSKPDSAMILAQQTVALAKKIKTDIAMSGALQAYALVLAQTGNYPQAIYFGLEALKLAEKSNDIPTIGWSYSFLADTYTNAEDYEHALFYKRKAKSVYELHPNFQAGARKLYWDDLYKYALLGLAFVYDKLNQPDSALKYLHMVRDPGDVSYLYGDIYFSKGNYGGAISYYRKAYRGGVEEGYYYGAMDACNSLAKTFRKINITDSSIYYAKKVLELNNYGKNPAALLEAFNLLANIYKSTGNSDSTAKYLQLTLSIKDSLFNQRKVMQMQSMTFNEQLRQQDIADAQKAYKDKIKTYIFIAGLLALLIVAFILFRSNRQKKKANVKIENAYTELKSTQAQLIQSEKMASLGELTAGIAHEIQNPLNFVNNFSEVNNELIEEMNDENDINEIKAIANDIKQNNEKISFHGKRADSIVKGMLQHSRKTKGVKEPTDINALCDEYLRLSYHGLRAKDKNFNADFKTDFDNSIGKINIVGQDIGRVLLNLFNNAFYAVRKPPTPKGENYKPLVIVTTKKIKPENNSAAKNTPLGDGGIEIVVSDNGNGIPASIKEKIFQPFFTTKPTDEGTGLGLSLSYDIIKAHGGEIKVETKESEGTAFIIQLTNKA